MPIGLIHVLGSDCYYDEQLSPCTYIGIRVEEDPGAHPHKIGQVVDKRRVHQVWHLLIRP